MKIAMMVRGFLQTPVPNDIAYSPATVAKSIAEGLGERGHSVTFFGPEGTSLANGITIETCGLRALATTQQELDDAVGTTDMFQNYRFSLYDSLMAKSMLERAQTGEFDCVIFNHFESALPFGSLYPKVPIVHILHDYIDDERREVIEMHVSKNQHFISISDSQRRAAPDINYAATVYNGIDIEQFAYEEDAEDYLLFSGRITPTKGVKEAVQVAVQAKKRLLIAGSLSKSDYSYFDENVKPFLDDKILFLGMLEREQLIKYYQKATALLMPIQWEEPFGLSMAEANSCGTPIIAFRRGSIPEVIQDGKNGYIVNNTAEMIMATEKIDKIKRSDCHARAKKYFSTETMVKGYELALLDIITKHSTKKPPRVGQSTKLVTNSLTKFTKQIRRPLKK